MYTVTTCLTISDEIFRFLEKNYVEDTLQVNIMKALNKIFVVCSYNIFTRMNIFYTSYTRGLNFIKELRHMKAAGCCLFLCIKSLNLKQLEKSSIFNKLFSTIFFELTLFF